MADMTRRRSSGGQMESRKRKHSDDKMAANVGESENAGSPSDFPCHFCSSVFVTQISLNRHVLTFHDGEVAMKQELIDESDILDPKEENYDLEESENGYYVKEEENGFYYEQEGEDADDVDVDISELIGTTNSILSQELNGNGTLLSNSNKGMAQLAQQQKVLKPTLSSQDLANVLAQVEQITTVSTSDFVTCPLCRKTFGRKELPIHIACEHGGAKFTCPYCGRNISRRDHLKRHIKNVHPEMCTETEIGPFPRNLNLCRANNSQKKLPTVMASQVQNLQHQQQETPLKTLPISIMTPRIQVDVDEEDEEDDFEGEDFLQESAMQMGNTQEDNFDDDSMQITVEPDLPFHDFSDYNDEDYSTPNFMLDSLEHFQQKLNTGNGLNLVGSQLDQSSHLASLTSNMAYQCSLCNAVFSSKVLLDRHESTHSELRPHKCALCGKGFLRKEHLSKHLSSVHSGMKFTCEFCGKDISRKDHLIRHIRNVHPNQFYSLPQEMEQDLLTQTQQQSVAALKTAQSMQPKPKKPFFNCDMCEATFVNVDDLHAHQSTVHADVRKYKCNYCCKAFKRKEHLTKHEVLHTGERKFNCRICGSEFQRKDALQEHIRRTHGIEPSSQIGGNGTAVKTPGAGAASTIPCNLCDQRFQDRGKLLSHMTTVHGLIVNSPPGLPKASQNPQRVQNNLGQHQPKLKPMVKSVTAKPASSFNSNNLGSLMDLINKGSITLSFHPIQSEQA